MANVLQTVLAFLPNSFGFLMHLVRAGCPRSSPFERDTKMGWQMFSKLSWRSFQTRSVS
ncbi:MAG: hypothetical protein LBQ66_04445 [Planctomycetaceae bacterium]|nr:hypothetical protein [Planctomycetaceae bacterium]